MSRSLRLIAAATAIAALLTGVAYAATRPVPENQPQTILQNSTATALPGDAKALEQILQKAGPVNYKIFVVDKLDGEDRTAYLDRVAEAWGQPAADQLLLVIYAEGNYDIRFYMGATFRQHDVSVDEMLQLVRTLYLPKARTGDPSGGLAALIGAVNQRIAGGTTAETAITVPDPFMGGERHTAAGQVEIAKGLLMAYLGQYRQDSRPMVDRLTSFGFDNSKLLPTVDEPDKIVFHVTFDVLPTDHNSSFWIAGNGVRQGDGWIKGKELFITAVREGGVWTLKSLATSP